MVGGGTSKGDDAAGPRLCSGRPPGHLGKQWGVKTLPAEKICVICGTDCAQRPRLKDSQGRYACQTCVEAKRRPKHKARPPAAAAPIADEPAPGADAGFSMDQYLGNVHTADANPCPKCGAGRPADAIVCMQCGFDSAAGRAMTTKVGKDKPKKVRSAPRLSGGAIFVIVILAMLVVLPGLAIASKEAAVLALLIAALWHLVAHIMMVFGAFQDEDTFWGWIGVLVWFPMIGQFCGLAFALYYCTIGGQRGTYKLSYWASFLTIAITFAMLLSANPDLLSQFSPQNVPADTP